MALMYPSIVQAQEVFYGIKKQVFGKIWYGQTLRGLVDPFEIFFWSEQKHGSLVIFECLHALKNGLSIMKHLCAWKECQGPVGLYGGLRPSPITIVTLKHMIGKDLAKGQLVKVNLVDAALCTGLDINHVVTSISALVSKILAKLVKKTAKKGLKFHKIVLETNQTIMKTFLYIALALTVMVGCKNTNESQESVVAEAPLEAAPSYESYGDVITAEGALNSQAMTELYAALTPGDTVDAKFSGAVNSVCQMKGCWMRLDLGGNESFVKFKDYAFFVPKDLSQTDAIVAGKAFVALTTVEDLKHFAEDAGKDQSEIDAITQPELSYSFLAHGVLIPESH